MVPPLIVHPPTTSLWVVSPPGAGHDWPEPASSPSAHPNENAIESPTTSTSWGSVGGGGGGFAGAQAAKTSATTASAHVTPAVLLSRDILPTPPRTFTGAGSLRSRATARRDRRRRVGRPRRWTAGRPAVSRGLRRPAREGTPHRWPRPGPRCTRPPR